MEKQRNVAEEDVKCTIVVPVHKAMNMELEDGIKIATAHSRETGNETVFGYHVKKRKVMSAITAGNCTHTGEINLDYLAKIDAGIFHTHPPIDRKKLPCGFSSTDLKYFVQENISEGILGCIDPANKNILQLTEINLRVPKKKLLVLSDVVQLLYLIQ